MSGSEKHWQFPGFRLYMMKNVLSSPLFSLNIDLCFLQMYTRAIHFHKDLCASDGKPFYLPQFQPLFITCIAYDSSVFTLVRLCRLGTPTYATTSLKWHGHGRAVQWYFRLSSQHTCCLKPRTPLTNLVAWWTMAANGRQVERCEPEKWSAAVVARIFAKKALTPKNDKQD